MEATTTMLSKRSKAAEFALMACGDETVEENVVYQFSSCPPSRQFESIGKNQSLLGDFVDVQGVPHEWMCGRKFGLKLRNTPRVLVSNMTANLAQGFSLSLWFQPGNTTKAEFQTILSVGSFTNDETDPDGCLGNLLQVGQYGNHLLLRYRDVSGTCRVLLLRGVGLVESTVTELMVVADSSRTLSFLDGNLVDRSAGMDLWNEERGDDNQPRHVRLFGSQDKDIDHFQGSIHRLSFRNNTAFPVGMVSTNETDCDETDVFPVFNLSGVVSPNALLVPQGSNQSYVVSIPVPNSIKIEIRLISLPINGVLQSKGQNIIIGSNASVPLNLEYVLKHSQFFTSPHINVHGIDMQHQQESFFYRLQSYDDDGFLVAESRVVEFPVAVQLVNHRPQIEAPKPAAPAGNSWTISDIQVVDSSDYDMNFIRVDVSSRRGRVTVASEEARSLLRQYDCSGRSASPWQCVGDGYQDRRLTFVAAPSDATHILKKLEYQSLSISRPEADNVTITIYDGEGGDCLTSEEHWSYQKALGNRYSSLHTDGCVSVKAVIEIPGFVVESVGGHSTDGVHDTNSVLPDLLFWFLFTAALSWACFSRLRKFAQRGTAIEADSDEDAEQGVSNGPDVVVDHYPSEVSVMSSIYWDEISLA
eukprot:scaffold362_cov176-Amphora_coffeaeformis.AAC.39